MMVLCLKTQKKQNGNWHQELRAGHGYRIDDDELPSFCIPVEGPALKKPRRPPPKYDLWLQQIEAAKINPELLNAVVNTARSAVEANAMINGLLRLFEPPEPVNSELGEQNNELARNDRMEQLERAAKPAYDPFDIFDIGSRFIP